MLTDADEDTFIKVTKLKPSEYLVISKDYAAENEMHEFSLIKPDFEFSGHYTELKAAKQVCEQILYLMGTKTFYKESGLRLAIEVVKEPDAPNVRLI